MAVLLTLAQADRTKRYTLQPDTIFALCPESRQHLRKRLQLSKPLKKTKIEGLSCHRFWTLKQEKDVSTHCLVSKDVNSSRHGICVRPIVARIALVRPERERSLQELLVRMARSGQLRGRVTDEQLLSLLDQVAASESARTGASVKNKITVSVTAFKHH